MKDNMTWEEYIKFANSNVVKKLFVFVKMLNVKIVLSILMILIIALNMKKM